MKNEDKKAFFHGQLKAIFGMIDRNLITHEREDQFIEALWEELIREDPPWLIPGWEKEYKDPK